MPAAAFGTGDKAVARMALARIDSLVEGIADTWPAWSEAGERRSRERAGRFDAGVDRTIWRYTVDFSQTPALVVTRMVQGSGALPPWPLIEGFTTPVSTEAKAVYYASATMDPATPLTVTLADLPVTKVQSAHVSAEVVRNANLTPPDMPSGTVVDPAFIYRTPVVTAKDPVVPLLDLPSQTFVVAAEAANLSAAIDDFLAPFLAQPAPPGVDLRDIRLEVGGSYFFVLADGGRGQSIRSGNQIFLTRNDTIAPSSNVVSSADPVPAATFRRQMTDAMRAWHAATQPSSAGASIRLPVTLYASITDGLAPLVRLGRVEIPVPVDRPEWWV